MTIFWLIFMVITAILEAVTVQLVSIWFTVGALGACIASMLTDSLWVQIGVFVLVSLIALIATRPIVKRMREKAPEPTNSDRHVGEIGIVVAEIDNDAAKGQVRVDSSIWSARSIDGTIIPLDAHVIIREISGVKLIVEEYHPDTVS